jgi:transcription elongation GreA/GreB family factor
MPIFTRRPEDWAPVPEEVLLISSPGRQRYHLMSCEYGSQIWRPHAQYYLTARHAQQDGYQPCRVCSPSYYHPNILRDVPIDDILSAYENVVLASSEDDAEEAVRRFRATPDTLAGLLGDYESGEVDDEKWPFGRLVGASVRLRWGDGLIGEYRLVSGEDEWGNGRDRISTESPLGNAITEGEVGDTISFESPSGEQSVTVLSISVPDDWGEQDLAV